MCLVPVLPGQESNIRDWEWTGRFKSLAGTNSTFKISGVWIQLLNPKVLPPTRPNTDANLTTYHFLSIELVAIADLLHEQLEEQFDRLPNITWSDTYPYCTSKGKSHIFMVLYTSF
jgi:hypothetical protein